MKYGIIDIGSNTIRLVIYRISGGGIEYMLNKKVFAKAVQYRQNGRMKIDGVKIIIDVLNSMKELASHHSLSELWCFATASLRGLSNESEVVASIREGAAINVDIISGDMESELGVEGLKYAFDVRNAISIDLGGGSCEISLIRNGKLKSEKSIGIGSVSMSEKYVSGVFPERAEKELIKRESKKLISGISWLRGSGADAAYLIGGSARAMCSMHKALNSSLQEINGYRMFSDEIEPLSERLLDMGLQGIKLADQYCPGRVFTLIPGMAVLDTILEYASIPVVRLSRFGVREGYLLHRLRFAKLFENR